MERQRASSASRPRRVLRQDLLHLRNDKPAAHDLLDRVVRFVGEMDAQVWESMLAGFADYERLTIPGKGGLPLPAAVVQNDAAGESFARVKAKIVGTRSVLGATTHFKPRLQGQNPTIAEYGFWALWDWMTFRLLHAEEFDVLARSYNGFAYQLRLYQAHGIPGFTEMGAAPLLAATAEYAD
jgi:hypothetical protein